MVRAVSLEPKNAYMSIESNPSGRAMLVKAHSSRALLEIDLSVLGNVTEAQFICIPQIMPSRWVMPLPMAKALMPPQNPGCSSSIYIVGLMAGSLFHGETFNIPVPVTVNFLSLTSKDQLPLPFEASYTSIYFPNSLSQ